MELLLAGGVWGDPEHAGEDAAGGLFGAGLVVAVVGAGFGGDAGGVFGGEVDFTPPVVLVAVGFGDEAEVGFDPFELAGESACDTGAPLIDNSIALDYDRTQNGTKSSRTSRDTFGECLELNPSRGVSGDQRWKLRATRTSRHGGLHV